jgi:Predicted membrane protein
MFFQAGPPLFLLAIVVIILLGLFIAVPVSLVASAFGKLGLTGAQGLAVFLLTLAGSGWNIPLWRSTRLVRGDPAPASRIFNFTGQIGRVRFGRNPFGPNSFGPHDQDLTLSEQVVAVNVGGCLVPCALSGWFLWQMQLAGVLGNWIFLCILIPALACYLLARPIPGVGIGVPVLLPPAVAAMTAILVAPNLPGHESLAPRAAYMAGALGTLIGADLGHMLNRRTLALLDAPLLSIGGAGTFDGIFLAGIIAVLLA